MDDRPSEIRRGFVVEAGDATGSVIDVPERVSILGRDELADIRLADEGISRRHLRLDGTAGRVVVTDEGSRNGTWVNGRREPGPRVLHDGDIVQVGPARLRFFDEATRQERVAGPQTGEVRRPGAGSVYSARQDQYIAAGNQTWNQIVHVSADDEPSDELFQGRGPGRVIAIIGMIVALGGFAWAAFTIFSVAAYQGPGIPDFPVEFGYAFGLFALGGLIASIGTGMSRARRRREGG